MASSSDLSANVRALLLAVREEGNMSQLMHQLVNSPPVSAADTAEFEFVSDGAMTDASKRRFTEDADATVGPPSKQTPVIPGEKKKSKFPEGIRDLTHWGSTVLTVSKFAKFRMTYLEIYQSTDKEKKEYVSWIQKQRDRDDFTPQYQDFVNYVCAMNDEVQMTKLTYPGTGIPREMREWRGPFHVTMIDASA